MKLINEAIDKYVDKFWKLQVQIIQDLEIKQIDKIVHDFIHNTLLNGNQSTQEQYSIQFKDNFVNHQNKIIAIKNAINPGLL